MSPIPTIHANRDGLTAFCHVCGAMPENPCALGEPSPRARLNLVEHELDEDGSDGMVIVDLPYRYLCTKGHHVVGNAADLMECSAIIGGEVCGARLQHYDDEWVGDLAEAKAQGEQLAEAVRSYLFSFQLPGGWVGNSPLGRMIAALAAWDDASHTAEATNGD